MKFETPAGRNPIDQLRVGRLQQYACGELAAVGGRWIQHPDLAGGGDDADHRAEREDLAGSDRHAVA